jgi:hypothetical protein
MAKSDYLLIAKTADAELKALEESRESVKDNIYPLIELTRGRKIRGKDEYTFERHLAKVKEIFKDSVVGIDLTSDLALTDTKIDELSSSENGYKAWCNFLLELKNENCFKEIIPTLQINGDDNNLLENFQKQLQFYVENGFKKVIFRFGPLSPFEQVLEFLTKRFSELSVDCVLDLGYVCGATFTNLLLAANAVIDAVLNYPVTSLYLASTSFPNNVAEIYGKEFFTFPLYEVLLYDQLREVYPSILYSDYGSIHPKRNDTIVMARGWIPRIDLPDLHNMNYQRQRREEGTTVYSPAYVKAAQEIIKRYPIPSYLEGNWGIEQIKRESSGFNVGSQPKFWISVRMNIHIENQCRRLKLI